eukprot:Gregarina_sp_Poly_1__7238@NODE_397_length_8931_cov_96_456792_g325_i0_p6_GENE_NODE_397_length_8931_cov_96_456792_g325_i0NODE_397_length_8931_cov_96_456792_g325_i0_p6_ORF_typecomplete_len207_score29_26DUF3228/PF11539_8/4_4e64_NODE_397_length_8931_cov_96_456792_g325_i066757295
MSELPRIGIADFALRRFDLAGDSQSKELDTKIRISPQEFLKFVRRHFVDKNQLKDGYAPFCKHLFLQNEFPVIPGAVELSEDLRRHVESGYEARTSEELPVLCRWIPKSVALSMGVAPAKYIDVILYSYEQVMKEMAAMQHDTSALENVDWFIISLKFQDTDKELPMLPITCMRNALICEGGSGVEIDRDTYMECVAFWKDRVEVG